MINFNFLKDEPRSHISSQLPSLILSVWRRKKKGTAQKKLCAVGVEQQSVDAEVF